MKTNTLFFRIPSGTFLGGTSLPKGGWRGLLIPKGVWNGPKIPPGGWRQKPISLPKGGWRYWGVSQKQPCTDMYRSKCGEYYFEFGFYPEGSHYEIDILQMPEYPARLKGDLHETHRLPSNHGNEYKICFGDDSNASSFEKAKEWAGVWAEHTIKLITSGTPFPNN